MNRFFVLGLALLTVVGSGCATRGYARRQAAAVNERVTQVEGQVTTATQKHDTDVARANERITATDGKAQQAAIAAGQANSSATQANASAAQASASAARADASAAQAKQR